LAGIPEDGSVLDLEKYMGNRTYNEEPALVVASVRLFSCLGDIYDDPVSHRKLDKE
jgi:hypothetical protein